MAAPKEVTECPLVDIWVQVDIGSGCNYGGHWLCPTRLNVPTISQMTIGVPTIKISANQDASFSNAAASARNCN